MGDNGMTIWLLYLFWVIKTQQPTAIKQFKNNITSKNNLGSIKFKNAKQIEIKKHFFNVKTRNFHENTVELIENGRLRHESSHPKKK